MAAIYDAPSTMKLRSLPLAGIDSANLVGGLGTRLRGVVDGVPKPLAPVLGRPFLYYLLASLPVEPLSLERQVLPGLTLERRVKIFPTDSPFLDIGISGGTPSQHRASGCGNSSRSIPPRMQPCPAVITS